MQGERRSKRVKPTEKNGESYSMKREKCFFFPSKLLFFVNNFFKMSWENFRFFFNFKMEQKSIFLNSFLRAIIINKSQEVRTTSIDVIKKPKNTSKKFISIFLLIIIRKTNFSLVMFPLCVFFFFFFYEVYITNDKKEQKAGRLFTFDCMKTHDETRWNFVLLAFIFRHTES